MEGFGIEKETYKQENISLTVSHEGFFKDNLKHGIGTTLTPYHKHVGEFYAGKEHGFGVMTYESKMAHMKTMYPVWEGIYYKGEPYLGLLRIYLKVILPKMILKFNCFQAHL